MVSLEKPDSPIEPTPPATGKSVVVRVGRGNHVNRRRDEDEDEGWFSRILDTCLNFWDDNNLPSFQEARTKLASSAMAIGVLTVGGSDRMLGTHIADDMARVKVESHSNNVIRGVEEIIHDLGKQAQQAEKEFK